MLQWNRVLNYCKANLALPSGYIEKTDEEIREYLSQTALYEFSTFFPDWNRTVVIPTDDRYKVPNISNQFYFFDDEDSEIISIKECYFSAGDAVATGLPVVGSFSFSGMEWWSLAQFKSNFFRKFSNFAKTYKFIEPNIVEVQPADDVIRMENFVVEYERVHKSLDKIPTAMSMTFMELCLAHLEINIGTIRSHYGNITSPFGDINIKGDDLYQRGHDRREKIVETLREESIPSVILAVN